MRPPGRLRPVPGSGGGVVLVPAAAPHPRSPPPLLGSCGMMSAAGFGAVAMEAGAGPGGTPVFLGRVIFSVFTSVGGRPAEGRGWTRDSGRGAGLACPELDRASGTTWDLGAVRTGLGSFPWPPSPSCAASPQICGTWVFPPVLVFLLFHMVAGEAAPSA